MEERRYKIGLCNFNNISEEDVLRLIKKCPEEVFARLIQYQTWFVSSNVDHHLFPIITTIIKFSSINLSFMPSSLKVAMIFSWLKKKAVDQQNFFRIFGQFSNFKSIFPKLIETCHSQAIEKIHISAKQFDGKRCNLHTDCDHSTENCVYYEFKKRYTYING